MQNSTDCSKILLVCLGQDMNRFDPRAVSINDIYIIFSPFGSIKRIVIFSRKFVFKAFVEMFDFNSAQKAREALNNRSIIGIGRARIYFSALQELSLSNKFIETWNYDSNINCRPNFLIEQLMSKEERQTNTSYSDDSNERIGSPNCLDSSFGKFNEFFDQNELQEKQVPISINSSVILVSNIDVVFNSANEIFNIFSCFGYIKKILFMKNLRKALVEYQTHEQAESAVLKINNQNFPSLKIKSNFSKYKTIDLKKNNKSENSQNYNEVVIPSPAQNRYSENESSIQKPSRSVIVSCERTIGLQHVDLYLLVQDVIQPLHIKYITDTNKKSNSLFLQFEFQEIEEALLVISKLHGVTLKDSLVSLSFC